MFQKLFKVAADVATLPVSAAVDVVTLGGALVDRDEAKHQMRRLPTTGETTRATLPCSSTRPIL